MTTVVLTCGGIPPELADAVAEAVSTGKSGGGSGVRTCTSSPTTSGVVSLVEMPLIPGRKDLRVLDELAVTHSPVDPTPSLEEIAAQPDVPHQADPMPAPQRPEEPVRVVVLGSDAALAAVVTRLMRIDALWISVGFVPVERSAVEAGASTQGSSAIGLGHAGDGTGPRSLIAHNWGVDAGQLPLLAAFDLALNGTAHPTALIRDDAGIATLGCAEIFHAGKTLVGEVIVDSDTLFFNEHARIWDGRPGPYGVRFVPTTGAPGLAATRLTTPSRWDAMAVANPPKRTLWGFMGAKGEPGGIDPDVVLTGRALQAGGEGLTVVRDGVVHPRTVSSVTFYRHLRDGQFVRR